ncbi:protoporphyrinogen oxidase [Streptomyces sp. NP160]|uniref:protoporphyrinogen oxidase n=1 Tax=Streptomyces sp. NP160 TaxID=2586637 RepID=UPI001119C5CC|nr:protoporphyrinogen oxidase [Streptomyces sp. NP160]TNM64438.1 protoporphyrinogen oxidase [Streptomyces sp. NP160]
MTARPRVVVVGGGVSGLAAAWALTSRDVDVDVVVLEASPRVGGPLQTAELGGVVVDVGAESLLARRPEAVDLAREVGLGRDLVQPATTRAAVVLRGERHPVPRGTVMGVPADPASMSGLLTAAEVARAADERLTEPLGQDGDVDVASFVAARLGSAVVDALVEPLLGGVYAGRASGLSVRSVLPALWPAARDGAPLLEAVRAAARASQAAAAAGRPALAGGGGGAQGAVGLVGTAAGGGVFAGVRGGVGRLPGAVAAALEQRGTPVRTSARVRGLRRAGGAWEVAVEDRWTGLRRAERADAVVLAVPPPAASALLAGEAPRASAAMARVDDAGLALVTLLLPPGSLDALVDEEGQPLSGLLVPPSEGRLVKAMTASSRKWAWVAQAAGRAAGQGTEVLRLSVGRRGEGAVLDRPDGELLAAVVEDGGDLVGHRLEPLASLVTRWPAALPQPDVGHSARVASAQAEVAALPGLALAGAAVDGVGVPACIAAARRAAAAVVADLTP